jgi:hypothetical protein
MIINKNDITSLVQAISNPADFSSLRGIVESVCSSGSVGEAYRLLQNLQAALKHVQSFNKKDLDGLLLKLTYYSFPFLNPAQQTELLSRYLILAFSQNVDVLNVVKNAVSVSWYVEDTQKRKMFLVSTEKNSERFSGLVRVGGSNDSPTVSDWIRDYNAFAAKAAKHDAYTRVTYMNESQNVRSLKPEQKEILKSVLEFYDWLRIGSGKLDWAKLQQSIKPPVASQTKPSIKHAVPLTKSKPAVASVPKGPVVKDLGPYVLGGEPENKTPNSKLQTPHKLQTSSVQTEETAEAETIATVPYAKYSGFAGELSNDVEDLPDALKGKTAKAGEASKALGVVSAKTQTKPEAQQPEPPKAKNLNPHALEDVLEKVRLKTDAKIPLSNEDTKIIIELIKQKRS